MKASTLGPKPAGAELLNMVYRPIEELKLDPANPRLHGKKQIRQIANSIKTFGFNVPILTDRDDQVICGSGRLLACRELAAKFPRIDAKFLRRSLKVFDRSGMLTECVGHPTRCSLV